MSDSSAASSPAGASARLGPVRPLRGVPGERRPALALLSPSPPARAVLLAAPAEVEVRPPLGRLQVGEDGRRAPRGRDLVRAQRGPCTSLATEVPGPRESSVSIRGAPRPLPTGAAHPRPLPARVAGRPRGRAGGDASIDQALQVTPSDASRWVRESIRQGRGSPGTRPWADGGSNRTSSEESFKSFMSILREKERLKTILNFSGQKIDDFEFAEAI